MATADKLPQLKLVRNKKKKGVYFGPFIEKGPARRVFDFLMKTFRLKICGKKIDQGCLYYHLGICAGSCRKDFDVHAYLERLELAKNALKQGHKKFLAYLHEKMEEHNRAREFEKSRELHKYYEAFESVFSALDVKPSLVEKFARKDVWVLVENKALFLYGEKDNILKAKHVFYFPFPPEADELHDTVMEYFAAYYRSYLPAGLILVNFDIAEHERDLLQQFFNQWHEGDLHVAIHKPEEGHHAGIVRMATIQATQELEKKATLAKTLKVLLKLPLEPHTIDCFDISHKQGKNMVGSCIRFADGKPDPKNFRHFKIKTVHQQDDYASLREVVERRYRNPQELPDLILIDGGKGQLNAVKDLFPQAEFVSLAKREETVFSNHIPQGKVLDLKTYSAQVLIALRDYAHHFAISYHRKLERTV